MDAPQGASQPWDRMGAEVERLLRADPRLAHLTRLRFAADEHQVQVWYGPLHEARRVILRGPEWWGALKHSRAQQLANVIADGLLALPGVASE